MEFLRRFFEDQLELRLNNEGNAVIGNTVFSPIVILRSDYAAYEEEFSTWLDDWLPVQNDNLEQILGVHTNRKRFTDLCSALKNGHLIPLVGSGMSVPSGFPEWSNFLRAVRLHSSMNEKDLEDLLAKWAFEEAADQLAMSMPGRLFDERIEHDLRVDNSTQISGAVLFLPEIFDTLVLTTNLDDLLETMYQQGGRRFSHILAGRAIGEYRKVKASSERVLLKFHGDCRSRDGRVLGKREYDAAYADSLPLRDELTTIFRTQSILCIGCSLYPDRTVGLLADVAKIDPGMPRHYTFLKYPNDSGVLRQREHFLTDRDIFPIWYPGDHDESIQALFIGMMQHLGRM